MGVLPRSSWWTTAPPTGPPPSPARPASRVLENPGNRGKGYAVRHGMLEARGEWALFTDADLSAPIDELEKLWRAAEQREQAQVAIGSRALDRSLIGVHQPAFRETVRPLVQYDDAADHRPAVPGHAVRVQAFRERRRARNLPPPALDGFGFDVEVLFIAQQLGYRALEVPVRWNDVAGTKVSMMRGVAGLPRPAQSALERNAGLYR